MQLRLIKIISLFVSAGIIVVLGMSVLTPPTGDEPENQTEVLR